jgi:hypothetical protein
MAVVVIVVVAAAAAKCLIVVVGGVKLQETLMLKANAGYTDVRRAKYIASEFRSRGLLAAVAAPLLWLSFMTAIGGLSTKSRLC